MNDSVVKIALGVIMTLVALMIKRAFSQADSSEKGVNLLREDLGVIKASDKRQWELIDIQRVLNDEDDKEIQALRERVLVLETLNLKKIDKEIL